MTPGCPLGPSQGLQTRGIGGETRVHAEVVHPAGAEDLFGVPTKHLVTIRVLVAQSHQGKLAQAVEGVGSIVSRFQHDHAPDLGLDLFEQEDLPRGRWKCRPVMGGFECEAKVGIGSEFLVEHFCRQLHVLAGEREPEFHRVKGVLRSITAGLGDDL